jgi:hypothetical protein
MTESALIDEYRNERLGFMDTLNEDEPRADLRAALATPNGVPAVVAG